MPENNAKTTTLNNDNIRETIKIRSMVADDIVQVAQIEQASFSTPWSAQGFAEALENQNACCLVAECKENGSGIVGYCVVYHAADEGEIVTIAVSSESRGRGIADAMFKKLKKELLCLGIETLYLDVRVSNTAARKLYEKQGFVEDDIRKRFYREPVEDAILMHCTL